MGAMRSSFPQAKKEIPRAYRPTVSFDASEQAEMHHNVLEWLKDTEKLKLWAVVMSMLHLQVRNKIASTVGGGRSGPQATLRAQADFAEASAMLLDVIDRVGLPKDIKPEQIAELLAKARKEADA